MVHIFIRKSQLTSKKKRVVIIVFSLSGEMKNRITSKKGKAHFAHSETPQFEVKTKHLVPLEATNMFCFCFFLHNGELSPAVYVFNVKKNRDWQSPE